MGGYELLYPKVKVFIRDHLFDQPVDLESPVVLRNLSDDHRVIDGAAGARFITTLTDVLSDIRRLVL